jgi:hypothetical protein
MHFVMSAEGQFKRLVLRLVVVQTLYLVLYPRI